MEPAVRPIWFHRATCVRVEADSGKHGDVEDRVVTWDMRLLARCDSQTDWQDCLIYNSSGLPFVVHRPPQKTPCARDFVAIRS